VREYETPEGDKVQEVGPLVYGYSMTVGPEGRPKVREFGNIKRPYGFGFGIGTSKTQIAEAPPPDRCGDYR